MNTDNSSAVVPMETDVAFINSLADADLEEAFLRCSGTRFWSKTMIAKRPFLHWQDLTQKACSVWSTCSYEDWLEAFASHPQIGDLDSLREKFASTAHWASKEQAGVEGVSTETLERLAAGNLRYKQRFGYIFIVLATGKSAEQMLDILSARLQNESADEFAIACEEQTKITELRLAKLGS